jgi:transposase
MEKTYVGVDVSKDRLDVHILPEGQSFAVARDGKGLQELVERLTALQPERIALEATGGFERVVAAGLAGVCLPLVVVNPAQVRHFAQALGRRAKTDPIDAEMIARFVEATKPDIRTLPDEAARLLADLVARRRQIVEMIGAERNREKRAPVKRIKKSIARLIGALEKELAEIDAEIDESVRGSPVWREKEDLLVSVPGVGPISARTLIADMPELGTLDSKRIGSLGGLAPFTRQSGQWKGKAMIGGGRPAVRATLFVCAMAAIRHNPVLKAFRDRKVAEGKPKKLVLIAVARKLLTILQRHPPRQTTMAPQNRLTPNTVAETSGLDR